MFASSPPRAARSSTPPRRTSSSSTPVASSRWPSPCAASSSPPAARPPSSSSSPRAASPASRATGASTTSSSTPPARPRWRRGCGWPSGRTAEVAPEEGGPITAGALVIDEATYSVRLRGRLLDLTYKEFELLKYLAQHPGRVFTRSQLLQEVWGYDYFGGTRTVDVHVRRLRASSAPTTRCSSARCATSGTASSPRSPTAFLRGRGLRWAAPSGCSRSTPPPPTTCAACGRGDRGRRGRRRVRGVPARRRSRARGRRPPRSAATTTAPLVGYAQVAAAGTPDAVAELVVDPAHRRAGHGRALLHAALAEGARSVWIARAPPRRRGAGVGGRAPP